jgi:hypothetical protein
VPFDLAQELEPDETALALQSRLGGHRLIRDLPMRSAEFPSATAVHPSASQRAVLPLQLLSVSLVMSAVEVRREATIHNGDSLSTG